METYNNNLTIGFIGLGLIGGSIAKAIHKFFPKYNIIAFDTDENALNSAFNNNIISKKLYSVNLKFSNCDFIFLCAPVHYNIEYLNILKPIIKESCILTDVGSVKSDISNAIKEIGLDNQFIGGHPMVGSEKSGYGVSRDTLIENAYYFLTPSKSVKKNLIDKLSMFIDELGAIPIIFDANEHDKITSAISHIPHIIASELVNLVATNDNKDGILKELSAGGFKDITRIASSNPIVWQHICLSNSENIIKQLNDFCNDLKNISNAIKNKDEQKIYNFFKSAKEYRDSVPDGYTGVIRKVFEVYTDIKDNVGALANVTNILAKGNINIKNIAIVNNREFENGVLRIIFFDNFSAKQATELLKQNGYTIYKR